MIKWIKPQYISVLVLIGVLAALFLPALARGEAEDGSVKARMKFPAPGPAVTGIRGMDPWNGALLSPFLLLSLKKTIV